MANSIIVTKDCSVGTGKYVTQAFSAGATVQPSDPYYYPLLWAGLANDSGIPGVAVDPTPFSEVIATPRPSASQDGMYLKWDNSQNKWLPGGAPGIPSWAGSAHKTYDPALGIYNFRVDNMRRTHAALIRALQGTGRFNCLVIGDSSAIGYNGAGASTDEANSFPRKLATTLGVQLALPVGSGIVPAAVSTSMASSRWSYTGTQTAANYSMLSMNAGATATYSSLQTGTQVEIYYGNSSTNFTYQIDGAGAVAVTSPGGAGATKVTISGLANTTHTVKINAVSNFVFLLGVAVGMPTSGIHVHNLAYGGSRASFGGPTLAWTDTTSQLGIGLVRRAMWDSAGITPDLVLIAIGGNDIYQGDTVANALAGAATIRGWYPNSDAMFIQSSNVPGTDMTKWNAYLAGKYDLAEALDIPLMDMRARMGTGEEALAAGLLGPDNMHAIASMNAIIGRVLATQILVSLGGLQDV